MGLFDSAKFPKEIAVCYCGTPDEPEPLVSTFAFPGAEYWCPKCKRVFGFLGCKRAEWTQALQDEADRRYELAKEYLHAKGVLHCSSMEWKGKRITYAELPQKEKDRLKKIREAGFKLEE